MERIHQVLCNGKYGTLLVQYDCMFTVAMATTVGMITSLYAQAGMGDLVLEAVAITASVFIVLTIFTLQSKWDFSFMGAGLGMCLWIMILWGFFGMNFGMQTGYIAFCLVVSSFTIRH